MSRLALVLAMAMAMATAGCASGPDDGAARAAIAVLALAGSDPAPDRLAEVVGAPLGEPSARALLDALDRLDLGTPPEVLAVERHEDERLAIVDLVAEARAGGSTRVSLQLESVGPDRWVLRWLGGPGVEWPERNRTDSGLTVSATPD